MNKHAISRTGWWIAGLLEKHSYTDRPPYWNNYRLIKAEDWRTAFLKATAIGERNARAGNDAFSGHQEFIGVSDLLPIYEEFEDGAEVLWQELEAIEDGDGVPLRVFSESYFEAMYEHPGDKTLHPTAGNAPV